MNFRRLPAYVKAVIRENTVEKYFVEEVRKASGWALKLKVLSWAGFPDRIVLWRWGAVDWVELKRPRGRPRKLQERMHAKLHKYNQNVFVLDTKAKVDEYVNTRGL